MKNKMRVLALLAVIALSPSMLGQEKIPAGVVHGPKAGFKISAPEGWVVDNEAGVNQDMPCVLYPKGFIVGGCEDGDVREGSQPSMGRCKRIRSMGHPGHEGKARHAKGENCVRQNEGRPRLLHQRIPCHEELFAMGKGRLRPTSAGSRLYRPHIPRSSQLPKRFRRARESSENPGLRRTEVGGGKWLGIRSSLQTAGGSACGEADRATAYRMAGEGA